MSLKYLNSDRIRRLAGRPRSSALVCNVDNKSSLVYKLRGTIHRCDHVRHVRATNDSVRTTIDHPRPSCSSSGQIGVVSAKIAKEGLCPYVLNLQLHFGV